MKLSFEQYKTFLEELAKSKEIDVEELKEKMANCGPPGITSVSSVCVPTFNLFLKNCHFLNFCNKKRTSNLDKFLYPFFQAAGRAASAVDRLTDVSKYTGSHKQRFDESGKGRGIAGRKDIPDQSGYVQGFKDSKAQ